MTFGFVMIAVLLASSVAWAQNSHFVRSGTATVDNLGNLVCSGWKVAGLGSNVTDSITCAGQATAIYACINNGGHHPSATNKETVNGPVSGTDDFTSGKNGTISGSITVAPPGAGTFSCPNGQDLVLASVSYTSLSLSDSFGATADISGSVDRCLLSGDLANDPTLCP
jgi:hypothetical protein